MSIKSSESETRYLSTSQQSLLAALSGILLSLSFLDAQYYLFAWVAFIPLLFAINGASSARSYCLGLMMGIAFSISAGYWIVDFLMLSKGYSLGSSILWSLAFWIYCSQLSALLALCFNALRLRSSAHEFILFPLVIVVFYSAFPMLFTVRLGESQSQFLSAIQAAEFTGVYGVDAVIALSNIVLFRLVSGPLKSLKTESFWPYLIAMLIVISWVIYGVFALQGWHSKLDSASHLRIGIVQPNETPTLDKFKPLAGYSLAYPPEMAMTERLRSAGAELVIWPEAKYKGYLDQTHVAKAFQHQLKEINTSLIFQDIGRISAEEQAGTYRQYNTAIMINDEGLEIGQYQKMKRIPFGEYVPLVSDLPIMRTWVEGFFGRFLNEIAEGSSHQFFTDQGINVIPLICYELIFPEFVVEAVALSQKSLVQAAHRTRLLVGLSSNAWFGDTRQPYQHINTSIMRAVENRTPMVHAVNNGPSVAVLPTGQVIFTSDFQQAGGYIVDLPSLNNSSPSFYSQYPKLFIFSIYGLFILLIAKSAFPENLKLRSRSS